MKQLKGKYAIITGASDGLGRALALAFAVGYPGWGAYGISKFAMEGMSQKWAAELQDTDVEYLKRIY